jgi:hypothetical protein
METNKNSLSMVRTHKEMEQTKGELFVLDEFANVLFRCFTLELPWKDNQRKISCIPAGIYKVVRRFSQRFNNHLHILDVPERTFILIHEANFVHQLEGCIAVGASRIDLNGDGKLDITQSVITKNKILEFITGPTEIIIS